MTNEKTKPDGYVVKFEDGSLMESSENGDMVLYKAREDAERDAKEQEEHFNNKGIVLPVYLGNPELLDWVEEMREFLKVNWDWEFDSKLRLVQEGEKLDRLNQILPEEK